MTKTYSSQMRKYFLLFTILLPITMFSYFLNLIAFIFIFEDLLIGGISFLVMSFISLSLTPSLIKIVINMFTEKNRQVFLYQQYIISASEETFTNGKGTYKLNVATDNNGTHYLLTRESLKYIQEQGLGLFALGIQENTKPEQFWPTARTSSEKYMYLVEVYSVRKL